MSALHEPVLDWYASHARDLPWRRPGTDAWAILVSEFMLQQTPVARVLPAYAAWLPRWPDARALAAAEPGEAVRAWGRLGYPRRALRLHETAGVITARHGGAVPDDYDALRAMPGIGAYTAAAVASFAYRQRHAVLDTNVRRVLARVLGGVAEAPAAQTRTEVRLAETVLPAAAGRAVTWGAAVMELGALVCTARAPRCADCPVSALCAWRQAGYPPREGPARRGQRYVGTDRQVRGMLLDLLREAAEPVSAEALAAVWARDPVQHERALDSLVSDGLVEPLDGAQFRLPAARPHAHDRGGAGAGAATTCA